MNRNGFLVIGLGPMDVVLTLRFHCTGKAVRKIGIDGVPSKYTYNNQIIEGFVTLSRLISDCYSFKYLSVVIKAFSTDNKALCGVKVHFSKHFFLKDNENEMKKFFPDFKLLFFSNMLMFRSLFQGPWSRLVERAQNVDLLIRE